LKKRRRCGETAGWRQSMVAAGGGVETCGNGPLESQNVLWIG